MWMRASACVCVLHNQKQKTKQKPTKKHNNNDTHTKAAYVRFSLCTAQTNKQTKQHKFDFLCFLSSLLKITLLVMQDMYSDYDHNNNYAYDSQTTQHSSQYIPLTCRLLASMYIYALCID